MKKIILLLTLVSLNVFAEPQDKDGRDMQGGVANGGGFRYTNSKKFLKVVSQELVAEITASYPDYLFENLSLKKADMIRIIGDVRNYTKIENSRHNPEGEDEGLMFDYGVDENGPYIAALKPFFDTYQTIPMKEVELAKKYKRPLPDIYTSNVKEIKRRLVHEFAHLLKKDEDQAEEFTERFFLKKHSQGMVFCELEKSQVTRTDLPAGVDFSYPNVNMFIDLPSGVSYVVVEWNPRESSKEKVQYPLKAREARLQALRKFFLTEKVNPNGCLTASQKLLISKDDQGNDFVSSSLTSKEGIRTKSDDADCGVVVEDIKKNLPLIGDELQDDPRSVDAYFTRFQIKSMANNKIVLQTGFSRWKMPNSGKDHVIDLSTGKGQFIAADKFYNVPPPSERYISWDVDQTYDCQTYFDKL
jgi:hypothetical protein